MIETPFHVINPCINKSEYKNARTMGISLLDVKLIII